MKKIIFLFVVLNFFSVKSQEIRHRDEFGGGIGVMHYTGDLSPTLQINEMTKVYNTGTLASPTYKIQFIVT